MRVRQLDPLLDHHSKARCHVPIAVRVVRTYPRAGTGNVDSVLPGLHLVLDQHPVPGADCNTIQYRQTTQVNWPCSCRAYAVLAIQLADFLGQPQLYKLTGGQHYGGVNLHGHVGCAGNDEVHAHDLRLAGALGEQRFEARCTVGYGHQITVGIVKPYFPDPPAANVGRDNLFGDHDACIGGVDLDLIERRTAALVDQSGLGSGRGRIGAVGITYTHLRKGPRHAQGIGVGLLGLTYCRENGKELAVLISHK
ncbi:hypothetical protein D3C72_1405140 [compost metagenome]